MTLAFKDMTVKIARRIFCLLLSPSAASTCKILPGLRQENIYASPGPHLSLSRRAIV